MELTKNTDLGQELVNDLASFTHDPYKFVLYSFPWGEGELKEHNGPDEWQKEQLIKLRDSLQDNPYESFKTAVASGHGPGKGALSSWLILWALSTFEDTRGIITANTETQLKTKSWAELSKWYRLFIAKHWFTLTATALFSIDPEHSRTWRVDMIPWSEDKSEAFAGLHNQSKRVILIFDEASAIADIIWEVSEGAMTDKNTEIIWAVFGNPTRNTGRFRECFGKYCHRWNTVQIDSRKCKMTNKEELQKWIDDYGEDSDFCRVRIKGEFPNAAEGQFISHSIIAGARGRKIGMNEYVYAAKIIGVDPAWSGLAFTAVYLRQGNYSKMLGVYKNVEDDFKTAGYIARFEDDEQADAVFIDYGYGTGIYSAGKQLNRQWILIPFGSESTDLAYLNKRAQMWGDMKKWLKEGGCIPDDPALAEQLASPMAEVTVTGRNAGRIMLESKKDMKKRGIELLDRADALAVTFAQLVIPKNRFQGRRVEGVYMPQQNEFANSKCDILG